MKTRIWIGDWLRAHRELGGGAALARMLDLHLPEAPTVPVPLRKSDRPPQPKLDPKPDPRPDPKPQPGPPQPSREQLVVTGPTTTTATGLTWKPDGKLPPKRPRIPRSPLDPLFERRLTRALLKTLIATTVNEGEILIAETADLLARRVPLKRLPQRAVSTVRGGLAIVFERRWLEPFTADISDLTEQLRRVVGADAVTEWWLESPRPTACDRALPWPPVAGTPVLVVTTHPDAAALARLAHTLAVRNSPLIALVPGRPDRPTDMPRTVAFVPWDPRTRVRDTLRARRRASPR